LFLFAGWNEVSPGTPLISALYPNQTILVVWAGWVSSSSGILSAASAVTVGNARVTRASIFRSVGYAPELSDNVDQVLPC
jgi:hypothetical protein